MKRSCCIHVSATIEDEKVMDVFVGERTISAAMGRLFLP